MKRRHLRSPALRQVRNRSAIQFYKGPAAALTAIVNGVCDEFFSRTGFTLDEDSRTCGGNLLHLVEDRLEGSAIANDPLECAFSPGFVTAAQSPTENLSS